MNENAFDVSPKPYKAAAWLRVFQARPWALALRPAGCWVHCMPGCCGTFLKHSTGLLCEVVLQCK